jgi:hypothetical protein
MQAAELEARTCPAMVPYSQGFKGPTPVDVAAMAALAEAAASGKLAEQPAADPDPPECICSTVEALFSLFGPDRFKIKPPVQDVDMGHQDASGPADAGGVQTGAQGALPADGMLAARAGGEQAEEPLPPSGGNPLATPSTPPLQPENKKQHRDAGAEVEKAGASMVVPKSGAGLGRGSFEQFPVLSAAAVVQLPQPAGRRSRSRSRGTCSPFRIRTTSDGDGASGCGRGSRGQPGTGAATGGVSGHLPTPLGQGLPNRRGYRGGGE